MSVSHSSLRTARERAMGRYLEVWQGEAPLEELDGLMTTDYVGHLGSRRRNLDQLKQDIVAYRASATDVRFRAEHRFGEGDYLATRVSAHAVDPQDGSELIAAGLNISRWAGIRLAEEWAVWEPLHRPIATSVNT